MHHLRCRPTQQMVTFGNRHDEPASPLPNEMQLVDDFILQVPRQDYNIVRLGLTNPIGMINRNVAARQKPALACADCDLRCRR